MRIIAGEYKGRRLDAVPGDTTRPSSDMLREAFASTVISNRENGFEGASVLDAFAGSGAVGIEALSRGADSCVFVDQSPKAISTIQSNLEQLNLPRGKANVLKQDTFYLASSGANIQGGPFDIVFLDPPYAMDTADVCNLLKDLGASGALLDSALVIYELSGGQKKKHKGEKKDKNAVPDYALDMLEKLGSNFEYVTAKSYGKSRVLYLEYKAR